MEMESITLSTDQQHAIDRIKSGQNIFLTGKAGTGKSTVIKIAIRHLEKNNNVAVLGTTGVAAMNVGGQTLHSFKKKSTIWKMKSCS